MGVKSHPTKKNYLECTLCRSHKCTENYTANVRGESAHAFLKRSESSVGSELPLGAGFMEVDVVDVCEISV
jgi:hypothetical protein